MNREDVIEKMRQLGEQIEGSGQIDTLIIPGNEYGLAPGKYDRSAIGNLLIFLADMLEV